MKDEILKLRAEGLSYNQIVKRLGCSKSTVSYYCGENQKNKTLERTRKLRKQNPLIKKIDAFLSVTKIKNTRNQVKNNKELFRMKVYTFMLNSNEKPSFTSQDVINKFGKETKCYLTGVPINLDEPRTYEFDHIIPRSRGGDNSIDNLGICSKIANQSKRDMTPEEYITLCKQILEHNGFIVVKNDNDH